MLRPKDNPESIALHLFPLSSERNSPWPYLVLIKRFQLGVALTSAYDRALQPVDPCSHVSPPSVERNTAPPYVPASTLSSSRKANVCTLGKINPTLFF